MKLLVTGALGHIGSRAVRELPALAGVDEVCMVDNMRTQRYASLFSLPAACRYSFIEADVLTADLQPLVSGAGVVIHLAAITDAAGSFERKGEVEHVNLNATRRVAEACRQAGVPMIHLSSTSVYGTQNKVVAEDCGPGDLKPQSPYAETKLKEEELLMAMSEEDRGFKFVTCRFGTIAGASPGMRFHTAVNKFCWQALTGQPVTVWRTALHQKRPYLALSDAVRAFEFIIRRRAFDGCVYNVLTENLTVHEILERIRRRIPGLAVKLVDEKIMNQLSYEVSCDKFKKLGFSFTGSIAGSVDETLDLMSGLRKEA